MRPLATKAETLLVGRFSLLAFFLAKVDAAENGQCGEKSEDIGNSCVYVYLSIYRQMGIRCPASFCIEFWICSVLYDDGKRPMSGKFLDGVSRCHGRMTNSTSVACFRHAAPWSLS